MHNVCILSESRACTKIEVCILHLKQVDKIKELNVLVMQFTTSCVQAFSVSIQLQFKN